MTLMVVTADGKSHHKKALIIVDVQPDFLPGGQLPTKEGLQILDPISKLLQAVISLSQHHHVTTTVQHTCYEVIVFTADKHPPGHISFAKYPESPSHLELFYRLDGSLCGCGQPCVSASAPRLITDKQAAAQIAGASQPGACIWQAPHEQLVGVRQQLWPSHCIRGTDGADIHPVLLKAARVASAANTQLEGDSAFPGNSSQPLWLPPVCAFDQQGLAMPSLCTLMAARHSSAHESQPDTTQCPSPPVLLLQKGTLDDLDDYSAFYSVGHLLSTGEVCWMHAGGQC
jgi:nicotinamidase-related amidase